MALIYATFALMAAGVARAQAGETGPNNNTTPTFIENEIVVHTVTVGYFADAFQPNSINVNPGDKVMFKIYPGNHSVIQSLYGWPCVPRESVNGIEGFYSGTYPNATANNPAIWNLTVKSTDTIFYYCGAAGSCINYGMLGVINPTNETDLVSQIEIAKQSKYYLEPNDTLPAAAAASISAVAASILSTSTSSSSSTGTSTSTPSSTPTGSSSGSSGISAGAIAGIVIGAVAALAIVGALLFWCGRKRGRQSSPTQSHPPHQGGPAPGAPPSEMTVDGVTYVPAFNSRASIQKQGFLPPYQYTPKDSRSRSPETVSSFSPMGYQQSYSPDMHSQPRFDPDFSFHAPQPRSPPPRHELSAQPIIREEQSESAGVESPTLGPRFVSS